MLIFSSRFEDEDDYDDEDEDDEEDEDEEGEDEEVEEAPEDDVAKPGKWPKKELFLLLHSFQPLLAHANRHYRHSRPSKEEAKGRRRGR